jgi:DNA invertase Pin-like site-specific DNA recombinase
MLIGYARVSTSDQETDMQVDALIKAGVMEIFSEKASSIGNRPELQKLLSKVRKGNIVVVYRIDRVARSLKDLLSILERLDNAGVGFKSLNEPIDTSTSIGTFLLQILGAVAQLERSIIRERVIAGQVAHLQRGGVHGRPSSLAPGQIEECLTRWKAGEKKAHIARALNVNRWVVDRVICQAENPLHPKYGPKRPVLGPILAGAVK